MASARVAAGLVAVAVLAGCGGDQVQVDDFPVAAADRGACREVLAAVPDRLADQPRRDVTGSAYAAAWGDPAIVLRCGVGLPKTYATDPCITRNGIGWSIPLRQTDDPGTDVVMTLAHRSLVVRVEVPREYRPNGPMAVMADLDDVVRDHTAARGECS